MTMNPKQTMETLTRGRDTHSVLAQWCAPGQCDGVHHWELDCSNGYALHGRRSIGPLDGPDTDPLAVAREVRDRYTEFCWGLGVHGKPLGLIFVDHARIAGVVTVIDPSAPPQTIPPVVMADSGRRESVLR